MYRPSVKGIRRNYTRLNRILFQNSLPPSKEINFQIGGISTRSWAYCESSNTGIKVKFLPEYQNLDFFLTILAHEMVHVYEAIYYGKMTHGPKFFEFREIFSNHGIVLSGNAGYNEDDFI